MSLTTTVDVNNLWKNTKVRRAAWEKARLAAPYVRLWDGDFNLRGEVSGEIAGDFKFIENETGTAMLRLPLDHYLAKWVMLHKGRVKRNIFVTFDKQGARWSGCMDNYRVVREKSGIAYLEIQFKHDYEQAKHIYCWSNPFLPAEFQFPRLWMIFGPAKWALSVTLLVNLMRLESSIWMLPDDPAEQNGLDQSRWRNVVKPFSFGEDNSNVTTVFSRFKSFHDVAKRVVEDAQLTIEVRRWLTGDPAPWPGANIRHGCLVWEIVDNSGWKTQTSFGGNLLTGLERAFITIASDGLTEGIDIIHGDPTFPDEYYIPGWQGTRPSAPWVIYEEGIYTGIESSEFIYYEATDTRFVTGGHSAPGVNEGISAAVNLIGDLIAAALFVPPAGGTLDALLRPLYTDVVAAFMNWGDSGRAQALGAFHYYEGWAEGADRAYTLAALIALRAKMWSTRAHTAHTIKVADAAPYRIGAPGYGHVWIGSRVGTSVLGYPEPNTVFVDRVQSIEYSWGPDGPSGWQMSIGYREPEDPVQKAFELIQELTSGLSELGLV
ncbi:Gp37-like protein [Nocardia sp. NPDC055002]